MYPQVAGVQGDGGLGMEGLDLPSIRATTTLGGWCRGSRETQWEVGVGTSCYAPTGGVVAGSGRVKVWSTHWDPVLKKLTQMTASQSRARSSRGRTTCRPWSRFPPWSRSHEEGGNKSLSPGLQGLSTGLYFSQGQEQSLWRDVIHCNSIYQLFFFEWKNWSCFPVHFQDHLQHHRLWGEECQIFFPFQDLPELQPWKQLKLFS